MRINITLDKDQKIGQQVVDAFQCELTRRVASIFPTARITVKRGAMIGVELVGVDKESDREALDGILGKFGKMKAGDKNHKSIGT